MGPRPGTFGGTRHHMGDTRDPGPISQVGLGTLILYRTIDQTPRTLTDRPETPMIGETGDPKLTSLVNQMCYK